MVTLEEVKGLKVQELKQELKNLGLAITGRKEELQKRLEDALGEAAPADAPEAATAKADPIQTVVKDGPANGKTPVEFKARDPPGTTGSDGLESQAADQAAIAKPHTGLSEEEKARQRAERFGIVSEKDKLAARAKRFGASVGGVESGSIGPSKAGVSKDSAEDLEKRKERAKRFNLPEVLSKEEAELKKKARLERFGSEKDKLPAEDSSVLASKLAARAERFALSKESAPTKTGEKAANGTTATASKPGTAPSSAAERKVAALAKAAAQVKPAANPEAEAKRQARAIVFQAS